jgi:GNAT superfamily N-acetyltransferase
VRANAEPSIRVERVEDLAALGPHAFGDLSDWFNPFLRGFARASIGGGGAVHLARLDGTVVGLLIDDPALQMASVFTRSSHVAATLTGARIDRSCFSEVPLPGMGEPYAIFRTSLADPLPLVRPHAVRLASPADVEGLVQLLRSVYQPVDERWVRTSSAREDRCFVVDVGDQLAGAGWVSVVDGHARLHSLTVHPRYRRLGIATALSRARATWALDHGATELLTEIADANLPSRKTAEKIGMRPVGRMFLYPKPL